MKQYQCSNCRVFFDESAPRRMKHLWPAIPGLLDRCEPGEIIPLGECPICRGLVYPVANGGFVATTGDDSSPSDLLPYTVLLDVGDERGLLQTVSVTAGTPEDERVQRAVDLARDEFNRSLGITGENPDPYPVIAVFLGEVNDICSGEE